LEKGEIENDITAVYYKNFGQYIDQGNKNTLIKCTIENCTPIDGGNDTIYINTNFKIDSKNLIICVNKECGIQSGTSNSYYINSGLIIDSSNPYKNALIYCEVSNMICIPADGKEDNVYINGNYQSSTDTNHTDNTNQLIICNENLCTVQASSSSEYYINANKNANSNSKLTNAIIKCTKPNTGDIIIKCVPQDVNLYNEPAVYFINNNYGKTDKDVDSINYLIKCTSNEGCVGYFNKEIMADQNEYYIHGDANYLKNAIIKCAIDNDKRASCNVVVDSTENTIYINTSDKNLIQCYKIDETNKGCKSKEGTGTTNTATYYINADTNSVTSYTNRLIKCTGIKSCIAVTESSGSIIYNNGKHKLCTKDYFQIDINSVDPEQKLILNVDIKEEFPGVKENNKNIIVNFNNERIEYSSETTTCLLTYNNDTVIEDVSTSNLQKRNLGICSRIKLPEDGFYIKINDNELHDELIKCKENMCIINKNFKEGFYKSGNRNKPIIQCILPGKLEEVFKTESGVLCYKRDYREGWYLNADESTNIENPMILRSMENGCQITKVEYPGWYVNNAMDDIYSYGNLSDVTIYPIIQCTSITRCSLYKEPLGNECKNNGDVTYFGNNSKIFKVCKSETLLVNFNKLDDTEYHLINIRNQNDIPGASIGDNIIGITKTETVVLITKKNGSVIKKNYYQNRAMYSCGENCIKWIEDKMILFEELTQNLLISNNCKELDGDTICEWNIFNKEGYVFIDSKNHLITDKDNQTVDKLYKCKYKNGKTDLKCYNMKNESTGLFPTGYFCNNEIRNSKNDIESVLYKCSADDNNWSIVNMDELKKCTYHSYKNNTCYISYDDEDDGYVLNNPKK